MHDLHPQSCKYFTPYTTPPCRDGAAAEAWACARLSSAMAATAPPGWSLAPNALRADIAFERGVKGEADVLLMDEAGECQVCEAGECQACEG